MQGNIFRSLPFYRIALPVFAGFIFCDFFSETSFFLNLLIYANILLLLLLFLYKLNFSIVQVDLLRGFLLQLLLLLFFVKIKVTQNHLKFSVQMLLRNVFENWHILISLFLPQFTVKSN